jgi:predicted dehydrogenase
VERAAAAPSRPRLGFVGVGWIGRHRMEAIVASGAAEAVAVCDQSPEAVAAALAAAPGATALDSLDAVLDAGVGRRRARHPERAPRRAVGACARARRRGVLPEAARPHRGRDARVVDAARAADRLLGVDLSYRHTEGMRRIRDLVARGELGDVYAVDLVFHNAYGPDKPGSSTRASRAAAA